MYPLSLNGRTAARGSPFGRAQGDPRTATDAELHYSPRPALRNGRIAKIPRQIVATLRQAQRLVNALQSRLMSGAGRLVAVVEDEDTIREAVCLSLRKEGYRTEGFDDGIRAWEAFDRALPDLVVLDIGLPRLDGLEICRRLRTRSDALPIVFVTSREEEFDRVLGLEIGADDYMCKPFSMRELVARVKVLLRRASLIESGVRAPEDRPFAVGDLILDALRISVTWKGSRVPLTVTEFLLLQGLARRPRHRQAARSAHGGRLSGSRLGQRSYDRQPRQADPQEVSGRGSRL